MGGSGGGGFFETSRTPEDISKKIRAQEEQAKNSSFETEVSHLMRELLTYANDRDVDTVQGHLETIKSAINSEIYGMIDLKYGGSVAKHTYVDGLSDIDTLAILNKSELASYTPDQVKQYFVERLKKRLPNTEIKAGHLAVTIKFKSGYEIQVLPALKSPKGIRISSADQENSWSKTINPETFSKLLRYTNIKQSGKAIPVVKLAKSIISSFPEKRRLSGYHIEALAIEAFSSYGGEKTPKAMLKYLFTEGAKKVLTPVKDKTGQSVHVDDYLGAANSVERKMVSDSMSTIARKMQNADGSRNIGIWEQILK